MTNLFENAWNKVSGETKRREAAADSHMTYEQKMSTDYREKYVDHKESIKFKGEVNSAEVSYPNGHTGEIEYKIDENGHKIEGSFRFPTCDEQWCCWGNPLDDGTARITVDGKRLSSEAATIYAKKYHKLIELRADGYRFEKESPKSVTEAIAREKEFKLKEAEKNRIAEEKQREDKAKLLERERKTIAGSNELSSALEVKE